MKAAAVPVTVRRVSSSSFSIRSSFFDPQQFFLSAAVFFGQHFFRPAVHSTVAVLSVGELALSASIGGPPLVNLPETSSADERIPLQTRRNFLCRREDSAPEKIPLSEKIPRESVGL